eukprot:scaffold185462_cov54-Attheya_sp.AAC.4
MGKIYHTFLLADAVYMLVSALSSIVGCMMIIDNSISNQNLHRMTRMMQLQSQSIYQSSAIKK